MLTIRDRIRIPGMAFLLAQMEADPECQAGEFWMGQLWGDVYARAVRHDCTATLPEIQEDARARLKASRDRKAAAAVGAGDSGEELVVGEAALQGPESPAGEGA